MSSSGGSALIIIICGLPGVGKTTVSKSLASLIDAVILSTDKIRKELIPNASYQKEEAELIYQVMILLAKYLQKADKNCILDATFNREDFRNLVRNKIGISKDQFFIVECICPEKVIISRIKNRKGDYSDADVTIYQKMKKIYEPIKADHISVDTINDPKANAKIIVSKISKTIKMDSSYDN